MFAGSSVKEGVRMDNISNATATYTGGGIYIYTGQLDNGDYFLSDDVFLEYCMFLNNDPYPVLDDATTEEWQNQHKIGEYSGKEGLTFNRRVLEWIIKNRPEGNYQVTEIESRLKKL